MEFAAIGVWMDGACASVCRISVSAWQKAEIFDRFTGNTAGRNAVIVCLSGVDWISAGTAYKASLGGASKSSRKHCRKGKKVLH